MALGGTLSLSDVSISSDSAASVGTTLPDAVEIPASFFKFKLWFF